MHVRPRRTLGPAVEQWLGLHYLAEHGYLCFAADYRQSGSYGWQHLQHIIDGGDDLGLDTADILAGVDHLIASGLADPGRVGLRGHSYGGYLVNWLVTQSTRFRAAVSAEGMTDLTAFPSPNTIAEVQYGGAPDEVPARYRRASPLTHTALARTPVLLFEGEHSFARFRQGEAFRDALRAAGVEVEYVCQPGAGHGIGRHDQQIDYLRRTLAWFNRHLRG